MAGDVMQEIDKEMEAWGSQELQANVIDDLLLTP
jgi:hypothetical protein